MARPRVDMHRLQELVRFHRLGLSAREAARRLKMSRDTYREYSKILGAAGLLDGDAAKILELAVPRAAGMAVDERSPRDSTRRGTGGG